MQLQKLSDLENNQDRVISRMRTLKNPPDEWRDAYADLLLYYDSYYDISELVLSRTCSLNEFKELFHEYDDNVAKRLDKMKIYLD